MMKTAITPEGAASQEGLLGLTVTELEAVSAAAGKNVDFRVYSNNNFYSGAKPSNFLRKKRR